MGSQNQDGEFEVKDLPIVGDYGRQRFRQFSSEDAANWYVVKYPQGKRDKALYPVMGRRHISANGVNYLQFAQEPREEFKSINFAYVVVGNLIYQVDSNYNQVNITAITPLATSFGPIYSTYLVINQKVFVCFVDSQNIYVFLESGFGSLTNNFYIVTDKNAPGVNASGLAPGFIVNFGSRIAVSVADSSQFFLSVVNLLNPDGTFDPAHCFSIGYNASLGTAGAAVFANEIGFIRQMGVLNNTLYIFTDFTTGIWNNRRSVFSGTDAYFPWTKNSTYDFNFGIANPTSLDISFGYMAFLGRNTDGLLQFMATKGDQPVVISTKAIDVLLQRYTNAFGANNPFLSANSNGFLYQYEDTIFYRMSGGPYNGTQILDENFAAASLEFCFDNQSWHRCIENNGERNRIQYHIYFNYKHLVTVIGENTVYSMSGQYYFNEVRNPTEDDPQASDAYLAYPLRYERVTPIISSQDYSEFETDYVEIDFVFGDSAINYSDAPFQNVQFIIDETPISGEPQYLIDENPDAEGQPIFLITDGSQNQPSLLDNTYNYLFNPHIELFYSDDGGVSFLSADVREFSQMGNYRWKIRWYQLGSSRNRVYKLICVSIVPIVVLGGVMNVRRISGGAN